MLFSPTRFYMTARSRIFRTVIMRAPALTLNTLINTYTDSVYLMRAKARDCRQLGARR